MLGVVSILLCMYGMVVMLNKFAMIKRVRPENKKNKITIETEGPHTDRALISDTGSARN